MDNNRGVTRETSFNGLRRIGLDTNILIKLYDQPYLFQSEAARIFKYDNLVFTTKVNVFELTKYITKKERADFETAKKMAKSFILDKNITPLFFRLDSNEVKKFEDFCNNYFKKKSQKFKCHYPDSLILLIFKKHGINKIYSTDECFRECAKFLRIDSSSLPNLDSKLKKQFRKFKNR